MTTSQLLARLNAYFVTNNEYTAKIFPPDLVPFISPGLQQLTDQVRMDFDKRNLLLKEVQIDVTQTLFEGFWKADLSQAQAAGIFTAAPFPQVSIGNRIGALFSKQPPAFDLGCQAWEDTYYVIGRDMIVETDQNLVPGTSKVAIIGYKVPTLEELPTELEDDLINIIANRLALLRQTGSREER